MTRRLLLLVALFAAGCSSDGGAADSSPSAEAAVAGRLRVAAAASLTEAFTDLGEQFEAEHPDVRVTFNFAASSALAEQIIGGAPTDVFASADSATMAKVADAGAVGDARTMARNRLALLVERGNPKGIDGLADLAEPGVVFVLCAPEVPCGRFGADALAKAGVEADPASLEENVKAVASKVTLGEADAGIVYVTDVKAAGPRAQGVDIDTARDPTLEADYPIAVTTRSTNVQAARAWVAFVLAPAGQAVLADFGFLPG